MSKIGDDVIGGRKSFDKPVVHVICKIKNPKIQVGENVKYIKPTSEGKFYTINKYGYLIPLPKEMQGTRGFKGEVGAVLRVEDKYVVFSIASPWEQQLYIKDLITSITKTKEKQKQFWWSKKLSDTVI